MNNTVYQIPCMPYTVWFIHYVSFSIQDAWLENCFPYWKNTMWQSIQISQTKLKQVTTQSFQKSVKANFLHCRINNQLKYLRFINQLC